MDEEENINETVIKRQQEEELKQKRLENLRKARDARKKKETALPKKIERIEVLEPIKEGNGAFKFALISLLGLGIMALFSNTNKRAMSDAVAPSSSTIMKTKEPEVVYQKEPSLYEVSANSFFNSIEPIGRSW